MNQRTLLLLLGILTIAGLAAYLLTAEEDNKLSQGAIFLPGMTAALNDVNELTIHRAGDERVATVLRNDGGWVVQERSDYPASFERVRKNLRGLADARIFEAKTARPEFYERLGVRDISDALATGQQLTVTAPGFSAQVIVGRTDEGGKLTYVRRAGESQSYLVQAELDAGNGLTDWLAAEVIDIPSSRVRSVEIRHPDGAILAVAKARSEDTNYTVADIPDGRSLTFEGVANSIGAALAGLSLDDVQSAGDFDPGEVQPTRARFETFDGLRIDVQAWELPDGERRVAFAAEPILDLSPPAEDSDEGPVDTDATAKIVDEAAELTQRLGGWIYTLPSFKSEQFVQRMDNLLAAE